MKFNQILKERGYHTALMTTFSFDPISYQNVSLVALNFHGCRNQALLTDTKMLNRAISEMGIPSLAGRRYHIAKRRMPFGSFHPKIILQLGRDRGRAVIGSANLTSAGMSGNVEACSLLRYDAENSYSAGIFRAVLDYIEHHADPSDPAMQRAIKQALRDSPWLRETPTEHLAQLPDGSRIGFLCEVGRPIADQFFDFIGADSIKRLIVVAPFQDGDLAAISKLREMLSVNNVWLIPDLSEQSFRKQTSDAFPWLNVCSAAALGVEPEYRRRLHAKLVIAEGESFDYVMTGSSNASMPGLFRSGIDGNAEANVVRTMTAGTAILSMQRPLGDCLETPLKRDQYVYRMRSGDNVSSGDEGFDGGHVDFEQVTMRWRPPPNDFPASEIMFFNDAGGEVLTVDASIMRNTWAEIPDKLTESEIEIRYARVAKAGGELSEPIPVAFVNEIKKNARPPQSGSIKRQLEAIEGADSIEELFETISKLSILNYKEMEAAEKRKAGHKTGGGAGDDKDDGPEENKDADLSEGFLDVSDALVDSHGNTEDRAVILESLRLSLNQFTAMMLFRIKSSEEEMSTLEASVISQEEKDITEPDGDTRNTQGDDDAEDDKSETTAPKQRKLTSPPQKRNALKSFIGDLYDREADLRKAIALKRPNIEMSPDHCLLFELVVQMIIRTAALDGAKEATAEFPFPPLSNEKHGGWVRMLSKCISSHASYFADPQLLSSDLEDDQLSALATLAASCQLMILAIQKYPVTKPVSGPLVESILQFEKCRASSMQAGSRSLLTFQKFLNGLERHEVFVRMTDGLRS